MDDKDSNEIVEKAVVAELIAAIIGESEQIRVILNKAGHPQTGATALGLINLGCMTLSSDVGCPSGVWDLIDHIVSTSKKVNALVNDPAKLQEEVFRAAAMRATEGETVH